MIPYSNKPVKSLLHVIEPFSIQPGNKVCILNRVSTAEQAKGTILAATARKLTEAIEQQGGSAVRVFEHEQPGRGAIWISVLQDACSKAIEIGATILLARSTDRILRSRNFDPRDKILCRAKLDQSEIDKLDHIKRVTGIRFMTYLPPDASYEEELRLREEWSRPEPDDKSRDSIRRFKEKWLQTAIDLRKSGLSYFSIAKEISTRSGRRVSDYTIRTWIKDN